MLPASLNVSLAGIGFGRMHPKWEEPRWKADLEVPCLLQCQGTSGRRTVSWPRKRQTGKGRLYVNSSF